MNTVPPSSPAKGSSCFHRRADAELWTELSKAAPIYNSYQRPFEFFVAPAMHSSTEDSQFVMPRIVRSAAIANVSALRVQV